VKSRVGIGVFIPVRFSRFQTFGNNVRIGAAEFGDFVTLNSAWCLSSKYCGDDELAASIFTNLVSGGLRGEPCSQRALV
jgi:hypothetical protein